MKKPEKLHVRCSSLDKGDLRVLYWKLSDSLLCFISSMLLLRPGYLLIVECLHTVFYNSPCSWAPILCRPATSRRQQRRLPPCPMVVALVPLKCSRRNLQICNRVPFTKEKMSCCPWPLINEGYRPAVFYSSPCSCSAGLFTRSWVFLYLPCSWALILCFISSVLMSFDTVLNTIIRNLALYRFYS